MENLAENAWTVQSDGRLVTYQPVLDSHAVDRAVAPSGGPPLFVQVKAHMRPRPDGRLAFAIPLSEVGGYPRWLALLLMGSPARIEEAYLVPGVELLRRGERGTLTDGRACVRATLSASSPTWSEFLVPDGQLGARLGGLAQAPGFVAPPSLERSQEEGAFVEESVVAALLGAGADLAPYRPAVDLGRDLLVQRSSTPAAIYLQIKGSARQDRPGLVRFQVRRRAFARDPALWFVFSFVGEGRVDPLWLVPSAELEDRAAADDPDHLSFEAHLGGGDARWGEFRLSLKELPRRLGGLLAGD